MLSRRLFQTLALSVVLLCVVLAVIYANDGGEPFHWITETSGSRMLGNLCALLFGLLASIPAILALRNVSDMKPLAEDWASLKNLTPEAIAAERKKLEAMRQGSARDRRRYHGMMAAVSACFLVVGAVAFLGVFDHGDDVIPNFVIAIFVAGVLGTPYHVIRAMMARSSSGDSAR